MGIALGPNITSLRGQRSFSKTGAVLAKSFERLASGRRINRAADDAAGLAVADSLNSDVRVTNAARRNVNDGISALNILTGALDSQKQILLRMGELAEQSANGTYSNLQRTALDKEYQELMLEFDRIASTATFNGVNLLRDSREGTIHIMAGITGADTSLLTLTRANSHRFAGMLGVRSDWTGEGYINATDANRAMILTSTGSLSSESLDRAQDFAELSITDSLGRKGTMRVVLSRIFEVFASFTPVSLYPTNLDAYFGATRDNGENVIGTPTAVSASANSLTCSLNYASDGATAAATLDLSGLQYQSLDAGVSVRQTAIGFTNLESAQAARRALDTVNNRSDDLSSLQGRYGAVQARLHSAGAILGISGETFAAAEARIRDCDVAEESSSLVRAQILQQAGSAVLAQANQQPTLALGLLAA